MSSADSLSGIPWYSCAGIDGDVVVSTRVRLARNLADFLFPSAAKKDEAERVQTLVFDSFSHFENPDDYRVVNTETLDALGKKILEERGVLDGSGASGIVMKGDGRLSCRVNSTDHVRIASFEPGLNCARAFDECRLCDDGMQKTLQFAASYEFGYLTSILSDAGSGMKVSIRVHLPSLVFSGEADAVLNGVRAKGLDVFSVYGSGDGYGASLGAYYDIATSSSLSGSEFDQTASVESAGKYLAEAERKFRRRCAENKPTQMRNLILRAFAEAKFSALLSLRQSVSIVSAVKWGLDSGILKGVDDKVLCGLLYRVQDGHLEFLLKNGNFSFEADIQNDVRLKIERLRALIVQETFEAVRFNL